MTTIVKGESNNTKMYIVAREHNGSMWCWESYDNVDKAYEVAREINSVVVING